MDRPVLLGAHESIAGGLPRALDRAKEHGAKALQIFTKNARGWRARALSAAEVQGFRAAREASRLPVLAHASYLINIAAEPGELRDRSLHALAEEIARCELMGIEGLVLHPGSHVEPVRGLALAAAAFRGELGHQRTTRILLENTAGQGTSLGRSFEELSNIFEQLAPTNGCLGVCLDTCHLFAAGYDITTKVGYDQVLGDFDRRVGLGLVHAFHLNDCKGPLGCRVDRHEDIGAGAMGVAPFRRLINDPRFSGIPAVLETEDGHQERNLAVLRSLLH
jgi:deoxyribonuclease-4